MQGDCINGKGRKIYSDGKIHDGYWVEGQYVGKEKTIDYLIKEIAEKMNIKEEFEEESQNEEEKAINKFSYNEILINKYGEKCKQYCKVNEDEYNRFCFESCLAFPEKDKLQKKREGPFIGSSLGSHDNSLRNPKTNFYYDDNKTVEESSDSGGVVKNYIHDGKFTD